LVGDLLRGRLVALAAHRPRMLFRILAQPPRARASLGRAAEMDPAHGEPLRAGLRARAHPVAPRTLPARLPLNPRRIRNRPASTITIAPATSAADQLGAPPGAHPG